MTCQPALGLATDNPHRGRQLEETCNEPLRGPLCAEWLDTYLLS